MSGSEGDAIWELTKRCWAPLTGSVQRPAFNEVYKELKRILRA